MGDIIRVEKNRNYTVMSNAHLFDKNLTLKAKGLLSLCLALPNDWEYTIAGLCKLSDDGRDSVRSALKNLKENGYLKIRKFREISGQFSTEYTFYESVSDLTVSDLPCRENRVGKTASENPTQLNTKTNHVNTNVLTCTKTKRNKTFVVPTIADVANYCAERQNTVDAQQFVDFYTAKGWHIGKNKMQDWKAAVRNWERNDKKNTIAAQNPAVGKYKYV